MIRQFKDSRFSQYYYCTDSENVISKKTKRHLKWKRTGWDYTVVLSAAVGTERLRFTYSHSAIINVMLADPVVEKSSQINTNNLSLGSVCPDFEYVLFSTKNQCSQYFFASTTVQDALAIFAKRGEVIDPSDVQILNVKTGKISKLKVETVKVYSIG